MEVILVPKFRVTGKQFCSLTFLDFEIKVSPLDNFAVAVHV